jgi:two-component system NtrC family sensor kinase
MSSAPATKPYRPLLLVEDEPSVMAYVRTALERSGYVVACVTNGERAIDMAKAEDFRGVISDMRTPGSVNGADLYDWLNLNRPTLAKRMLFITGDTVNEETARALERTGVPYIEKPFRVQQLLEMVKTVIGDSQ